MLAIENLKRARRTILALADRPPVFPAECRIGIVERELTQIARKPFDADYLRRLATRFQAAAQVDNFREISPKDWRRLVYVLWDGDPPLVENQKIFDRLRDQTRSGNSAAPLRRLIFSYFSRFDLDGPSITAIGFLISDELNRRQSHRLAQWQRRNTDYKIFSPNAAIKTIPAKLLAASDIAAFERDLGLDGQLAQQGFVVHLWAVTLAYLERMLKSGEAAGFSIDRILKALAVGKKLRFQTLRIAIANCLLSPWASRPLVDGDLQKRLKNFFLDHLGDPYTRRTSWHGVNSDAVGVMRRWLAEENLRLFFELISKASDESDYATGHWKYRRQFWTAYWERGALDEAWMVLGSKVEKLAKETLTPGIGYGTLKGGNDLHAVLLMRVGTLVFAEWSYNGKCRAWASDDKLCPLIGSPNYHTSHFKRPSMVIDARYASDGISHINSQAGYWQTILAKFIRDRTNIKVTNREFMP